MMTFHHRLIQFDDITEGMEIPEARRDLTLQNVLWLLRNIHFKNSNHPNFGEAVEMLKVFQRELSRRSSPS